MIEFFKGNVSAKTILENDILPENIALSSISVMELYFGAKNKKELMLIKKFLYHNSVFIYNIQTRPVNYHFACEYAP